MSLALEWRSTADPAPREESPRARPAERPRRGAEDGRRVRIVFVCFSCVAAFVCGLLLLSVILHVMVVQNEMRARELEKRIELEKRDQEALRLEIASLEAPARVERIAVEELRMEQVARVEYLETPAFRAARSDGGAPSNGVEGMVSDASSQGGI